MSDVLKHLQPIIREISKGNVPKEAFLIAIMIKSNFDRAIQMLYDLVNKGVYKNEVMEILKHVYVDLVSKDILYTVLTTYVSESFSNTAEANKHEIQSAHTRNTDTFVLSGTLKQEPPSTIMETSL